MTSAADSPLRTCLREPVPEILEAARMLDEAVTAHLVGDRARAAELLRATNMPAIREWTESLWGAKSRYAPNSKTAKPAELAKTERISVRMPAPAEQAQLHTRDGYHCRFCLIPVIRKQVRESLRKLYPDLLIWGRRNVEQHAALQCMWAQYDHVVPHASGGTNELSNVVVTCAPCNYAKMHYTLEQCGLANPFDRPPVRSMWDGLERLLKALT